MHTLSATHSSPSPAGLSLEGVSKSPSPAGTYGRHTFRLDEMQRRLPRPVFEAIQATIRAGDPLDMGLADAVASAMKDWALEHGATHFSHWFQPLTGATAEKHDAFLSLSDERPLVQFSGKQLVQAEPDASSFPSGGMRSTFEARGYTAWDPTSPAFLVFNDRGATLMIPSVFLSYRGEALDTKTPLLRTMRELSRASVRALQLMGRTSRRVVATLGWEQEYFLVQRRFFERRPDLEVTGRTVLGTIPPKGQQMEDNYFGAIDEIALNFMAAVESEAWRLGIPVKTRHNEVAPHQYEVAPVYAPVNTATDQNQMLMELMRRTARRHGLTVLFHEKPFSGVNGSGKHNNWSVQSDAGRNLLDPGDSPDRNVEFLFFLCAVLRGVHRRADLLRSSVATVGNDHRLGANEAPPAIISVFLGDRLTQILEALLEGQEAQAAVEDFIEHGVSVLPQVRRDNTDRNRTSPLAFTGDKFEFRAVGASQSTALPCAYLNLAVTEALDEMCDLLEARLGAGEERNAALVGVARDVYAGARPIVFNGNNYGEAWVEEAARRGLSHHRDTPAALRVLSDPDTKALFERYGVFRAHEVEARHRVLLEQFGRMLHIEAVQMLRMVKTGVMPAALGHLQHLAGAVSAATSVGAKVEALSAEARAYAHLVEETQTNVNALRAALRSAPDEEKDPAVAAQHAAGDIRLAMEALRRSADTLERRTAGQAWPYPTYHEMLFQ